jgi:hypothetical protein
MLTLIWTLMPLVAGYVIFRIYQKKAAEREAASSKRFDEIFGGAAKLPSQTPPQSTFSPAPITANSAPALITPPPSAWVTQEKFLQPRGKLIYYLLKSELPDHEVFAQVSLGAVIAATQPLRKPLEGTIDFVVCDKQMKPLAAIGFTGMADVDSIGASISAAGMRWVQFVPDALPQRGDIRALVLGA